VSGRTYNCTSAVRSSRTDRYCTPSRASRVPTPAGTTSCTAWTPTRANSAGSGSSTTRRGSRSR
jgi:hypothetical protein